MSLFWLAEDFFGVFEGFLVMCQQEPIRADTGVQADNPPLHSGCSVGVLDERRQQQVYFKEALV